LVILLGPPASGKTALGRMLGERGWRFREWELELLDAWRNRENLVAHETEALAALHQRVRDLAAAPGLPAVYETTGLADAEFLDQVVTELPTIVVKLDVGLNEARRRARQRPRGEHLADDDAATRRIWNEFATSAARAVDLVIDTEKVGLDRAADLVIDAVDRRRLFGTG
jgi:shikimate kinase